MGGLASSLVLRLSLASANDTHLAGQLAQIHRLERTLVFYGALLLLLAGLTTSMIPSTKIYHTFWVMTGFVIFLVQAWLVFSVSRLNRKQRDSLANADHAIFWRQEKMCRTLISINLLIGLCATYLMVTKYSPN